MNKRKLSFAVSVFIILMVIISTLGFPEKGRSEEKIVIGVVNCLSGFGADMGLAGRQGGEIALEEINGAGGINGKKIELIIRDSESNPGKGVAAVNELIFRRGVKVIMGTNLTHVSNAVNKIINDQKVLYFTMGTGNILVNPEKYPYTFRFNVSTEIEAKALIKYVVETIKAKKIGMIHDSTAYGQTGYGSVINALKPYGINLVGREIYNPGDTDMTGQLLKLKNAGAEILVGWGTGPHLAQVTNSAARIKWYPTAVNGIGLHNFAFKGLSSHEVAKNWYGTLHTSYTYPKGGTVPPTTQQFNDRIIAKYGRDIKSFVPNAAMWYDMIQVYAKAVEKVGSQDPDDIIEFMKGTSRYEGIVANYSWGPKDFDGFNLSDLSIASSIRGDVFGKERID